LRKSFKIVHSCFAAMLAGAMVVSLVACSADEVVQVIDTARDVAQQTGNIVSAVNPEYGSQIQQVASGLGDLEMLVKQYEAAVAAGKPGIATQIQAVSNTAKANLAAILADAHVKDAEHVEYITLFVAIANSAIVEVLNHLPASQQTTAQAAVLSTGQPLPTIPFKTHKDLKNAWNSKVKSQFPKAQI